MARGDTSAEALIDAIYEAGLGSRPWAGVLGRLAEELGASAAIVGVERFGGGGWGESLGDDPSLRHDYFTRHADAHPLAATTRHAPTRTIHTDRMVLPKSAFHRTAFYAEWARPQDMAGFMNLRALRTPDAVGNICFARGHRAGDFEEAHVERLDAFAPHLCRAMMVGLRLATLRAEHGALAGAFDRLGHGVIGLGADARISFANGVAERLLAAGNALRAEPDGRIAAARAEATSALRRQIALAAQRDPDPPPSLRVDRPEGRPPLSVSITPVPPLSAEVGGLPPVAVLAVIVDLEAAPPGVQPEVLRQMFGLTAAEAAVALHVARGQGVPEVARALAISRATVRSHLSAIFGKTGVRRQAELAWVVARLGA